MTKIVRKAHVMSIVTGSGSNSGTITLYLEEPGSSKTIGQVYLSLDEVAGVQFGQAVKLTIEPV